MSDTTATGAATTEAGGTQETTETTTQAQQTTAATGVPGKPSTEGATTEGKTTPPAEDAPFEAKLPEGVEIDKEGLKAFTDLVNDKTLNPHEKAQRILDLAAKREQDGAEAFANTVKGWADTVAADKELGNAENQAGARQLIETYGTPELRSLLNSSGMGNHPELVRFVIKVSKAMGEDAIHRARGDAPAGAQRDPASILYDKTPKA